MPVPFVFSLSYSLHGRSIQKAVQKKKISSSASPKKAKKILEKPKPKPKKVEPPKRDDPFKRKPMG